MKYADHTRQMLLDLDGLRFVYEDGYWIKYAVSEVAVCEEWPHGIKYSLTLHDHRGDRIFGIDNAHLPRTGGAPTRQSTRSAATDHVHTGRRVYRYEFVDAETLLADFDKGVVAALRMRGVNL